MISVLPAILIPTLLGYLSVTLLLASEHRAGVLERLSLAYPLGIGLVTLQMFFVGLAMVPLQLYIMVPLLLLEIILLAAWMVAKKIDPFARNVRPLKHGAAGPKSLLVRICEYLLLVWIVLKAGSVFLETYLRPIYFYDSFTNWSVRAKVFFFSNSLLLTPSSYDFFGKGINHSAGNYPPYNPLAQMWMALWLGQFDEVLVKFWTPFFLIAAALLLYKIASEETSCLVALVIVTIFVSSPLVSLHATETMNDLPLATYILFALYSLLNVIRGRLPYLALVGTFAALAMFAKVEGPFIAVPILCSCCFVVWSFAKGEGKSIKAMLARLLIPLLLILPYLVFKLINKFGIAPDQLYFSVTFRPIAIWNYLQLILGLQNFNVVFISIPILFAMQGRVDKELLCITLPVMAYAAFFISVYMFVSYYSDNGRFWENIFRNTLTYYPAACLILLLLLKRVLAQTGWQQAPSSHAECE